MQRSSAAPTPRQLSHRSPQPPDPCGPSLMAEGDCGPVLPTPVGSTHFPWGAGSTEQPRVLGCSDTFPFSLPSPPTFPPSRCVCGAAVPTPLQAANGVVAAPCLLPPAFTLPWSWGQVQGWGWQVLALPLLSDARVPQAGAARWCPARMQPLLRPPSAAARNEPEVG